MTAFGRVLVVGAGVSGRGAIGALAEKSEFIDVAEDDQARADFARSVAGVRRVASLSSFDLSGYDLVVVSPGVRPSSRLSAARCEVIGELELGARLAQSPMIAVTGTNGKTTVATLAAAMLGDRGVLCGNAGTPLSAVSALEEKVLVVEVSSFQAYWARTFSPRAACLLNFTPDHLDWHGSPEEYWRAKSSFFTRLELTATAVLNRDDESSRRVTTKAKRRYFSIVQQAEYRLEGGWLTGPAGRLCHADELTRSAAHDISNILAAWGLADSMGADLDQIRSAATSFAGLRHRIEVVGEVGGVTYIDDSKATTPASVVAALRAYDRVILIAGGKGKGLSYEPLAAVADRIRALVAIGEAGRDAAGVLAKYAIPIVESDSMADAVAQATRLADGTGVVLLSPGATSYDWYANYEERGDDFRQLVTGLKGVG